MFSYIKKHYGAFYIVAWIVFLALCGIAAWIDSVVELPLAVWGLILLPANLISWPAALGYWEDVKREENKNLTGKYRIQKLIIIQLVVTTLAPLFFFVIDL